MASVDRARLARLREREEERFVRAHPRSRELFERGRASLLGGVPMNWMGRWPGSFPPFITEASGARLADADGNEYVDLCLGTGAPERPVTGAQAAAAGDVELDRLMHLHLLNRGVLMTPFHNMALMCPATTEADVDRHTEVFEEAVAELVE